MSLDILFDYWDLEEYPHYQKMFKNEWEEFFTAWNPIEMSEDFESSFGCKMPQTVIEYLKFMSNQRFHFLIKYAFNWSTSEKGHEYWSTIWDRN